jgi:hypothetical protein
MNTIVWVSIIVIVLLVLGVWFVSQQRRARLRDRFGPEYERAVERTGNRLKAEQELAAVADERDRLNIRDLSPAEQQRWTGEWSLVQSQFVDHPQEAVDAASELLSTVMRERGYPVDDFDQRAALLSADHPRVVEHYRAARDLHQRQRAADSADTEDLRQAFMHYRELFEALVPGDHTEPAHGATRTAPETTGATRPLADQPAAPGPTPTRDDPKDWR